MGAFSGLRSPVKGIAGILRMVTAMARQRRRLWLASAAIALSVGYLAGALTLLNRVSEGLTDLSAAGIEKADLVVEGDVAYESALEQTRRLISSSVAQSLIGQEGVASVVPRVEDIAVILDPKRNSLVAPGLTEQPIGANWPGDPQMSPYEFVGKGRAPTGPDEVVIDHRSARRAGISVGDQASVVARSALKSYKVVGVVTTPRGDLPDGSSLALFSTDQARELFAMEDTDTRVALRLKEGADLEEVRDSIAATLPPGSVVVTGAEAALHRQESITRSFTLVRSLIMGFAGLALVVGMITAANSLTLLYSERRLTFATFRLVGAKKFQILGAALVEAALLAIVASLAGAPLGLLLGAFIELILGALGTSIPVGGSPVSIPALVLAVVVGAIATVLAAIVPAWRACGVPPIEAITPTEGSTPPTFAQRMVKIGSVALATGMVVWAVLVIGDLATGLQPQIALAVIVGMVLLGMVPTGLAYAVSGGILAFPERSGALKRIGARDALRNRTRTAATTGALLLATAVVSGIAVFLASFSASLDGDVSRLIKADLVVDSETFTIGGLPDGLLDKVSEIPGVTSVSGWQLGRVYVGELPVRLTGMDGQALNDVLSPGWVDKEPDGLGENGIALSKGIADQMGVGLGGVVPVRFTSEATEMMNVEGIYTRDVLLGGAIVNRSLLSAQVPKSTDIFGLVSTSSDVDKVRPQVEKVAKSFGVKSVLAPSDFVNSRSELLRGFERVIQWMLLFTLIQALVGVVNTLLLSVGERRREFGLLRAAGATRQQILRVVLVEGGSFAVVGTLLGIMVGVVGAWGAMTALRGFGLTGFVVPVPILLLTAVAAAALGIVAAIVPARWAAAVPPLEAVVDTGGTSDRPTVRAIVDRIQRRIEAFQVQRPKPAVPSSAAPSGAAGAPDPGHAAVSVPATATQGAREKISVAAVAAAPVGAIAVDTSGGASTAAERVHSDARLAEPAAARSDVPPRYQPWMRSTTGGGAGTGNGPRERDGDHSADASSGDRRGSLFSPSSPSGRRARHDAAEVVVPELLAEVARRWDRSSIADAGSLLSLLADQLQPNETVSNMVQGWVKGLPCVVARTEERVVVVVSKFPEPLIQTLGLARSGMSIYGPPNLSTVSMAVIDGRRLLEVNGIRDREEAVAMAKKAGADKPGQRGYF